MKALTIRNLLINELHTLEHETESAKPLAVALPSHGSCSPSTKSGPIELKI
jgi:hypothetical protein